MYESPFVLKYLLLYSIYWPVGGTKYVGMYYSDRHEYVSAKWPQWYFVLNKHINAIFTQVWVNITQFLSVSFKYVNARFDFLIRLWVKVCTAYRDDRHWYLWY